MQSTSFLFFICFVTYPILFFLIECRFSLFVLILRLVNSDETTILLTFIAFAAPVGMNTIVFPAAFDGDTKTVAYDIIGYFGIYNTNYVPCIDGVFCAARIFCNPIYLMVISLDTLNNLSYSPL